MSSFLKARAYEMMQVDLGRCERSISCMRTLTMPRIMEEMYFPFGKLSRTDITNQNSSARDHKSEIRRTTTVEKNQFQKSLDEVWNLDAHIGAFVDRL